MILHDALSKLCRVEHSLESARPCTFAGSNTSSFTHNKSDAGVVFKHTAKANARLHFEREHATEQLALDFKFEFALDLLACASSFFHSIAEASAPASRPLQLHTI
jgi:hypothetical protein